MHVKVEGKVKNTIKIYKVIRLIISQRWGGEGEQL